MIYFGHSIINGFRSHEPRGFYDAVKGHTGVDIAMPIETPLSLPIVVEAVDVVEQPEMGLTLYMKDSAGTILVFAHLSKVLVNPGERVDAERVFALSGNSGARSTGPHLHFELIATVADAGLEMMSRSLGRFHGFNIDPVAYLDQAYAHWAHSALLWAEQHQLIQKPKSPNAPVTWGELAVFSQRLAERVLDWARNS